MNQSPRILFLTTSFPTLNNPGSGIFVSRLVNELKPFADITVLTPATTPGNSLAGSMARIIPVRYAPAGQQTLAHSPGGIPEALSVTPWNFLKLIALMISLFIYALWHGRKAQLVHSNWSIAGVIGGLSALLLRKPSVVTLRGADVTRAMKKRLDRTILRLALLLNDRITCVSESQLSWLEHEFPGIQRKSVHIPNGVDLDTRKNTPASLKLGRDDSFKLISVGSLITRKGYNRLVQAVAQVPEANRITVTIVGEGPERNALEDLIDQHNLKSRITLTGQMAPEEIPGLLAEHDAFILCSYSEGRSNALLEAMAASMPIIATDIPGTNEIITSLEDGILVPCDDPEALRHAVQLLSEDATLRSRLGKAARMRIESMQLTWRNSAERYFAAYQGLIHDSQPE